MPSASFSSPATSTWLASKVTVTMFKKWPKTRHPRTCLLTCQASLRVGQVCKFNYNRLKIEQQWSKLQGWVIVKEWLQRSLYWRVAVLLRLNRSTLIPRDQSSTIQNNSQWRRRLTYSRGDNSSYLVERVSPSTLYSRLRCYLRDP